MNFIFSFFLNFKLQQKHSFTGFKTPCVYTYHSAAMNIGVYVSFSIMVSSGYMPSSGIVGSYDNFIHNFWKIFILFSIVAVSICIPTNSARGFPFLMEHYSATKRSTFDSVLIKWMNLEPTIQS